MSLRALVASALTLDESDADVIMCCQKLDHEMVRDVASLAKTWEEVKMALPGAARWHIEMKAAHTCISCPSLHPTSSTHSLDIVTTRVRCVSRCHVC